MARKKRADPAAVLRTARVTEPADGAALGKLRGAVITALRWHFEQFILWEQIQEVQRKKEEAAFDTTLFEKSIATLEQKKTRLYEKYREGDLTKDEYLAQKTDAATEIEALQDKIQAIEAKRTTQRSRSERLDLLSDLIHQYNGAEALTKELERIFVDQVSVYDAEHIQIRWKFEDVFAKLSKNA
jgi:chromosome segregation ATPase